MIISFVAVIVWSLLREIEREETTLKTSISGLVEVAPQLYAAGVADLVRTDRLVLFLVDPTTRQPVALHFESPLVPPQTIRIGQDNAMGGKKLYGSYLVVGITDKDGEIFRVSPGEVYGRSPGPVALGSEKFKLVLNQPFRGSLFNAAAGGQPSVPPLAGGKPPMADNEAAEDPRFSISGNITVTKALAKNIAATDRLIVLMFDPEQRPPVAFKIIPHTLLPQRFSIGLPPERRSTAKKAYLIRVITDKNNNPFGPAPGEVVGRAATPIPLGTKDLRFVLDQDYVR